MKENSLFSLLKETIIVFFHIYTTYFSKYVYICSRLFKETRMKKLPIVIFLFIMTTAICSGLCSFRSAKYRIEKDVCKALELTLTQMPCDVVSADTIRCYRNYLTIPELRDTACIALRTVRRDGKHETELVAETNCSFITILKLSDQRVSCTLLIIGILWMIGSMWYMRRFEPELTVQRLSYGGIVFIDDKFMTEKGEKIHLTPMQYSLLEMFMNSETHSLSKHEICDRLWPKKPDASDTLYTLIKRIKPIIEANSNLKIESNRGKSYSLELR